jgi:lysophospholipase L1-like esterase
MTFSWRRTLVFLVILVIIAVVVGVIVTRSSSSQQVLVGLGDSYASGEGNTPFTPTSDSPTNKCHSSISGAYPVIAAHNLKVKSINNACSGATTDTMLNGSAGMPSQLTGIGKAKYVTVTIGGNDVDALGAIFNPPTATQFATELQGLQPKLVNAYKQIHAAAPHAHIIVVGYPGIIPQSQLPGCFLNANELAPLRTALTALNNTIDEAAKTANVESIDPTTAFAGHELCTQQPWINGIDLGDLSGSLHPNLDGQTALANLVTTQIKAK